METAYAILAGALAIAIQFGVTVAAYFVGVWVGLDKQRLRKFLDDQRRAEWEDDD